MSLKDLRFELKLASTDKPGEPTNVFLREHIRRLLAALDEAEAGMDSIGKWMSAALDDPRVCTEMKRDIDRFLASHANLRGDSA